MVLGSNQSLTEMSIRNLPGGEGRPARKADNLTAICEQNDAVKQIKISCPWWKSNPAIQPIVHRYTIWAILDHVNDLTLYNCKNIWILIILYDFCLWPANCYIIMKVADAERHKQTVKPCALVKITNIAENCSAGGTDAATRLSRPAEGLVSGPVWYLVHIAVYSVLLCFSRLSYIRKMQACTLHYCPECAALLGLVR
jgi:hypothetical protein